MMTEHADFKRRVRERMDRTGERYTTARAHLLRSAPPGGGPPTDAGAPRVGGLQDDVAATANALARAGVTGLDGAPIDEVEVFGLGGGIGFMVAVFVYEGYGPTLAITTRTTSYPAPFIEPAIAATGADHEVVTTGSPAVAQRHLDEALDAGHQVLCQVETAALPHRSGDPAEVGAGPRIVGILDRAGAHYLLDDRAVRPVTITAEDLAAARIALKKARHRMIVVTGPGTADPISAARRGLARTVAGYDEAPARSFANNVGTVGLHTWAERLTATSAKGWQRIFSDPADLHLALRRVVECVHHDYATEDANRPLFAGWLRRLASDVDGTGEAAALIERSGRHWHDLAELARSADPTVDEAAALRENVERLLDERGADATREVRDLRARFDELRQTCTLSGADAGPVFAELAHHARTIAGIERQALTALAS